MWCKNVWEILPELDPIVACTWFFFSVHAAPHQQSTHRRTCIAAYDIGNNRLSSTSFGLVLRFVTDFHRQYWGAWYAWYVPYGQIKASGLPGAQYHDTRSYPVYSGCCFLKEALLTAREPQWSELKTVNKMGFGGRSSAKRSSKI